MWGVEGGEQEELPAWEAGPCGIGTMQTEAMTAGRQHCSVKSGKEDQTKKKLKRKDVQINNSRDVDVPM